VVGRGSHEELRATVPGYRHLVEAYERDRDHHGPAAAEAGARAAAAAAPGAVAGGERA
jgi:hypothetical protein